jgi:DNA-binding transcriptional regulator of glucitol operon
LRRLGIAGVCLVSLAVCCGLAWWQWERFSSAGGTFQNLGYVLQWPLFGLFPAFMFWRIRKLRRQAAEAGETAGTETAAPRPQPPPVWRPAEEDDELAAYNSYLAELNARDQQTS